MIGVVLCGTGCGNHDSSNDLEGEGSQNSSYNPLRTYKPGNPPTGTFSATIERLPLIKARLLAISDNDVLFFNRDTQNQEYVLVTGKKEQSLKRVPGDPDLRLRPNVPLRRSAYYPDPHLLPNGTVKMTYGNPILGSNSTDSFFNDGSFLVGDVKNLPGHKRATYFLKRDWHSDAHFPASYTISPEPVTLLKSKEIYRADNPVRLLEKTEKDVIWIQDHRGTDSFGVDQLIRYAEGKSQVIAMPDDYKNVYLVAQTGDHIAATFGIVKGELPYRTYLKTSSGWTQLPVPAGYDFSTVKKIFRDGTVLGNISTSDSKKSKNVLWQGNNLVILDDLPGWPKQGRKTDCVMANRNGLVYVEEDNGPGNTRPPYLLKIHVN